MPGDTELSPEIVALKSGLPIFYGRILAVLERIADALEGANENPGVPTGVTGRRRKEPTDA